MKIDIMNIDDYDDVMALWQQTKGMGLNNLDDSREGIDKYLTRNPRTCFVAREDEVLAGVVLSGHDGRRGFIYHLAVMENQRKNGIGRELVDCAIKALKKEGIHKIALVVFKKNQGGNLFWEKIGFEERSDLVYRNKTITDLKMKAIEA